MRALGLNLQGFLAGCAQVQLILLVNAFNMVTYVMSAQLEQFGHVLLA